ncbi:MAG TPA: GldM family protein [Chitinophagaceae bacterium]
MALPKEPRQKMINLMYLVLTALLALNVSAEILNAFKTVNSTLEVSSSLAESKILGIFRSFDDKMSDPKTADKAKIWHAKADQARKYSEDAYNYIQTLKTELLNQADFNKKDSSYKEDNLDAATRMFVEHKKGNDLRNKLQELKTKLLSIDPDIRAQFEKTLPIDLTPPPVKNIANKGDWAASYFRMVPTVAALTILSKFQNDVKNAEAQIVEHCHRKVGEVVIQYDQFQVIANSSSTYMMPGEEFTINAGIGAYSSKAVPTITVGGATASRTPNGDYELKTKAESTPGEYSKLVIVSYTDPNTGQPATVKKEIKYTVGAPSGLTVSTDKTRVFYQGLENEVSVTGSGGSEKIEFSVVGPGQNVVKKGNGKYVVTFTGLGNATVTAVDTKNNTRANFTIPVKRVPDPLAVIGGVASGSMPVSRFRAQQGVIADLKDFIFEGVKYDVAGYFIMFTGPGFAEPEMTEVNGPAFTPQIRQWMTRCQEGTTIIVGNIKVRGPGGSRALQQGITLVLE